MRILPTRFHGALDYVAGLFLAVTPWVVGFAQPNPETWSLVVLGTAVLVYSLFTDYEWGSLPLLSMTTHLWLDLLVGALLAASPWLFGFATVVWVPHLALGAAVMALALCTRAKPSNLHYLGESYLPR